MCTNIVPNGVSLRIVVPRSLSGRARFGATLQVLRLRLEQRLLEPLDLVMQSRRSRPSARRPHDASAFAVAGRGRAFSVAPVDSTWLSREPSRYTVTPLHFSSYAIS